MPIQKLIAIGDEAAVVIDDWILEQLHITLDTPLEMKVVDGKLIVKKLAQEG